MKLVQATERDSEKLIEYFARTELPGVVNLQYQRKGSFFDHYRSQSDDFVTYMLLNDKGDIEALATLVFREGVLFGQKQILGYATDLRVSNSRRAVLQWSQHFLPVLEQERSKRDCKYIFSVVARGQAQAINAFIRPRSIRRQLPRYYLFKKFQIVGVHGHYPWTKKPIETIQVEAAKADDFEALDQYLQKRNQQKPLYFYNGLDKLFESSTRLKLENFLIAKNSEGDIIGCVAPTASRTQDVVATHFGPKGKSLQDFLYLMSWIGLAKPLPSAPQALPAYYLRFLEADNPDIFYSLVAKAYDQREGFLLYPNFQWDFTTLPPRGYIESRMECGLYCILAPYDPIPDFLRPHPLGDPPALDLTFL